MKHIFRNDFIIEHSNSNNSLILKSKNNDNIMFPLLQAEAIYLSLFNGMREDDEISQISNELFGDNSAKLKSVDRFLLPAENAYLIFGSYEHKYDPMDFLTQKYEIENANSFFLHNPRYLTLCLTHKCHRRCIYCYAEAAYSSNIENDAMSILTIKKILDEAFDMAIEGVLLTGGEPMMHPYIYDIINYLGDRAIYTQVLTKHLLSEKGLKNANTSSLDIYLSIDSNDTTLANYLTGSQTYFDDILQNIKILKQLGIPFKATVVITRKNESTILDTVQFLLDQGAVYILTNHYSCEEEKKSIKELMLSAEEKRDFDQRWRKCIQEKELECLVFHKNHPADSLDDVEHTYCSGLTKKVTIDYNGDFILCDRLSEIDMGFGNVKEQNILEHWNSEIMYNLRYPKQALYHSSVCMACDRFETCSAKNSCYARSLIQNNTLYSPVKEVSHVCNKG